LRYEAFSETRIQGSAYHRFESIVAIITFADRARGSPLVRKSERAITPGIARAGGLGGGKWFGKTMSTVFYAMIYIVSGAVVVTVAFLVVTALTS